MKKVKIILAIAIVFVLFIIAGYDERHDTIECKVISYDAESVCLLHPNGEYYSYYGSVGDAKTVKAVFDNKGTINNPYDDEIVGIK